VIYPDSPSEMAGKGWSDEDLLEVLETVHLAHILAREGGWDTAADWKVFYSPSMDNQEVFNKGTVSRDGFGF
jgi:hypothetical protein